MPWGGYSASMGDDWRVRIALDEDVSCPAFSGQGICG
jgi:hypothetical protein